MLEDPFEPQPSSFCLPGFLIQTVGFVVSFHIADIVSNITSNFRVILYYYLLNILCALWEMWFKTQKMYRILIQNTHKNFVHHGRLNSNILPLQ